MAARSLRVDAGPARVRPRENRLAAALGGHRDARLEDAIAGGDAAGGVLALHVREFSVPHEHPALPGHFPDHPVVPGVLVLDQVLSLLEQFHRPLAGLRLPQVKFLQPLLPGQQARVELSVRGPASWRFQVVRGDTVLVTGDIIANGPAT